MSIRILLGDCRDQLKTLPDESVHCVVTSPPYWGLRDYGIDGQLGLERSLGNHVGTMVEVFREVRRVLRKDGTLWLNYGDSYATSVNGRSAADTKALGNDDRTFRDKPFSTIGPISRVGASGNKGNPGADHAFRITANGVLKPKDLCGIPWRVAFALQEDGWWLRQDIIWSKPNPMPESIRDRCTKAHEYLFLMAKSERYYFDADAISEIRTQDEDSKTFRGGSYVGGQPGPRTIVGNKHIKIPGGWDKDKGAHGTIHRNGRTEAEYQEAEIKERRNKRSVWTIATAPFAEAHFATFPPALIEPCILAGCPKDGTVLDPFGGAGTTGLVADRLGRNAILIELNPAYIQIADKRLREDAGMFVDIQNA